MFTSDPGRYSVCFLGRVAGEKNVVTVVFVAVTVVFVAVTDSHAVRLLQTEWMTSFKNRRGKRHVFDYTGLKCLYMQVFLSNNMSHMKAFTAFVVQS